MLGLVSSIFLLAPDAAPSMSPISFSQGDELNLLPEAPRHQQPRDQSPGLNKGCDAEVSSCYRMAKLVKRPLSVEYSKDL